MGEAKFGGEVEPKMKEVTQELVEPTSIEEAQELLNQANIEGNAEAIKFYEGAIAKLTESKSIESKE